MPPRKVKLNTSVELRKHGAEKGLEPILTSAQRTSKVIKNTTLTLNQQVTKTPIYSLNQRETQPSQQNSQGYPRRSQIYRKGHTSFDMPPRPEANREIYCNEENGDAHSKNFQSDEDENHLNLNYDDLDEEPRYKLRRIKANNLETAPFSRSNISQSEAFDKAYPECSAQTFPFPAYPSMAMPEFTIDKDIIHFIYDMTAYLRYQMHLSERERAHLILVGVKGAAKDVVMGYANSETDTTDKVFQILRHEFKRLDKSAAGLYGVKQEADEKISIFAGKIRKYVRGLGVRSEKFDHVCIDFLKLGCLPHIKTRLIQLHPQTFQKAIKIAAEAESENNKASKTKAINNLEENDSSLGKQATRKEIDRLYAIIQEQDQRIRALRTPTLQSSEQQNTVTRVGNGVLGTCYFCHKVGHKYQYCRQARESDKQRITEQIQKYRQQHYYNKDRQSEKHHQKDSNANKVRNSLNLIVANPIPRETRQ